MTKPREPETGRHSPQALADRADDGFRSAVRSAARIVRSIPSGMGYGVSKIGRVFIRKKKRTIKPAQAAGLKPAAGGREEEVTSWDTAELTEYACSQAMAEEPALVEQTLEKPALGKKASQKVPPCPPQDLETLLRQHTSRNRVQAIVLRKALADLLRGSEGTRERALETLVGLGQVAGPFLVASLQEGTPEVIENALEGLAKIGWHCLESSISGVLGSPDVELRIIALRAVGRLTDERQRPFLERGVRDPSVRVRRRALSYLSWHDSPWTVAEMMRLCDDQQPSVRWAAVEALMTLRPSEASDHLKLMMPSLDPIHQRRAAALLEQRKKSTKKRAKLQTPSEPEIKGSSPSNVPEQATQEAPKKDDSSQTGSAGSSPVRKRKAREPRQPSGGNTARKKDVPPE